MLWLWLWHRPAAAAPILPLAWELPLATPVALKRKKKKKKSSKDSIKMIKIIRMNFLRSYYKLDYQRFLKHKFIESLKVKGRKTKY